MKILVLIQDGIPVKAYNLPKVSREYEIEQFGTKIRQKHTEALKAAFLVLHPTREARGIGSEDLPSVATAIVELENFCPEAQALQD